MNAWPSATGVLSEVRVYEDSRTFGHEWDQADSSEFGHFGHVRTRSASKSLPRYRMLESVTFRHAKDTKVTQQNLESNSQNNDLANEQPREGAVLPRIPRWQRRRADLKSLSGTARESARNYLLWKAGQLSDERYLIAVRGMTAHKDVLASVEQERTREEVERLTATLTSYRQALEASGVAVPQLTGPSAIESNGSGGENAF